MLHPNAKNRLLRVAPTQVEVSWIHPIRETKQVTTVEPDVRWKRQDQPIDYPVIAMELSPENIPKHAFGDREGADTIKHPVDNDDTVAYDLYIGTPMRAELHITVGVDSSKDGVPAHMIADAIANEVFFEYEYNSDHLHRQGTTDAGEPVDYEWPMSVSMPDDVGITNFNRIVDGQEVQRRQLTFEVEYRWWRHEEVPSTAAVAGTHELYDQSEELLNEFNWRVDFEEN